MALQDLKDQAAVGLDSAFALGVASVGGDKIYTQAELDAAVSVAKEAAKSAAIALVDAEDADLKAKLAAL